MVEMPVKVGEQEVAGNCIYTGVSQLWDQHLDHVRTRSQLRLSLVDD